MTKIRSRIHEFFSLELMKELYSICKNSVISDNNIKVSAMLDTLRAHKLDFIELGPGTNRLAILIDNYVFKLALDKWGLQDNLNEFTISQELQPYVVKTYETNELISVCEYVTVISREEFQDNKDALRAVLSILAESYLLGDVGTVNKNFANWGYRDNGDLVILDFAYIYRVQGDELLCSYDQSILEYDENFHKLKCPDPKCNRTYSFMDLRRRISMEQEKHENTIAKQFAFKLTEPVQEFKERYQDEESKEGPSSLYNKQETTIDSKEETSMKRFDEEEVIDQEEQEDSYLETLELMKQLKGENLDEAHPTFAPELDDAEKDEHEEVLSEILASKQNGAAVVTNTIEIDRETETEKSQIRIITQTPIGDTDGDLVSGHTTLEVAGPITVDTDPIQEILLDAAVQVEEAIEDAKELVTESEAEDFGDIEAAPVFEEDTDGMSEEDLELYNIMEEDQANIVTVSLQDVDGDGENEIVIDQEQVPVFSTPTMINVSLEDDGDDEETDEEELALRAIMAADSEGQGCEEEVEFTNTVKLTDSISVETSVKMKVPETEADKLRRELMGEVIDNGIDEEKVEKLAEDYTHLQDQVEEEYENQYSRRKGGNRDWK